MPDSGFLISCASIAPSAVTERAALRWVNCLSIFSAIARSCSIIATESLGCGRGAMKTSTDPRPARSRRGNVDLVTCDRRVVPARVGHEPEHRRAERQEIGQDASAGARRDPCRRNVSAATLASITSVLPVDGDQRLGQRIEDLCRIEARFRATAPSRGLLHDFVVERPGQQRHGAARDRRSSQARVGAAPARRRPPRRRRSASARDGGPARDPSLPSSQSRCAIAAVAPLLDRRRMKRAAVGERAGNRPDQPRRADRSASDHHAAARPTGPAWRARPRRRRSRR